ncbi:MAG: hypothetical protein P8H13_05365 [Polaribacter sp.]|nr:hypothetical protein [Polaribacter sp.]MDG1811347.1 hypothetical protein [Polaribacter sp.]MDG1993733.1 hypothetical protein [Polaribacter sp.]
MGKLFLFFSLSIATLFTAKSQVISKNAIGLRGNYNNDFRTEITYQSIIGYTNRLEVNLGLFKQEDDAKYFKATTIFQWVWQLANKLNWHSGFGGGVGNYKDNSKSKTFTFATGSVGIEYNFKAPVIMALDYHQEYGFYDVYEGLKSNIGLSLRYQF